MAKIVCNVRFDGEIMMKGKYMSAEELEGKDVDVTIRSIEKANVQYEDTGEEETHLIGFEETHRRLDLNKTNCKAIGDIHGENANEWIGKRITLCVETVLSFGDMVDAIRIRPDAPAVDPNAPKKPKAKSFKKKGDK